MVCKLSGIVAAMPDSGWKAADLAPVVNHCIDQFGPDRVLFGSDWPMCIPVATLGQWLAALREIIRGREPALQRKLLHQNALRVYKLS